jgi:hypothetical protein
VQVSTSRQIRLVVCAIMWFRAAQKVSGGRVSEGRRRVSRRSGPSAPKNNIERALGGCAEAEVAQCASIEMALLPFMFDSAKSSLGAVASACRSSDATNFVRAALI